MTEIKSAETAPSCVSVRLLPPLAHMFVLLMMRKRRSGKEEGGQEERHMPLSSLQNIRHVRCGGEGLLTLSGGEVSCCTCWLMGSEARSWSF